MQYTYEAIQTDSDQQKTRKKQNLNGIRRAERVIIRYSTTKKLYLTTLSILNESSSLQIIVKKDKQSTKKQLTNMIDT